MSEQAIKDKTAIVGIGWTAFSRQSGTTAQNLALEASLKAIDDAGLSPKQIDGVFTHYHKHADTAAPRDMVRGLGLEKCNFEFFNNGGGSWNCSAVMTAASLVFAGVCNYVLLYRAMNRYSEGRETRARRAEEVSGDDQWRTPFGNHHAAATFGHVATAHMAKYGTTSLDFAHLAVTERDHALLNTKAMMRAYRTMLAEARERIAKLKAAGKTEEEVVAVKPTADYDAKFRVNERAIGNFLRVVYRSLPK